MKEVEQAARLWCERYGETFPRRPTTCPFCGSPGGFHAMPGEPHRWYCFSTRHSEGMGGIRAQQGFQGDALDLYLHQQGLETSGVHRVRELQSRGLLEKGFQPREPKVKIPKAPVVVESKTSSLQSRQQRLKELQSVPLKREEPVLLSPKPTATTTITATSLQEMAKKWEPMAKAGWVYLSLLEREAVRSIGGPEAQILCTAWLEARRQRLGVEEGLYLKVLRGEQSCIGGVVRDLSEIRR